jgi:hypothetical protein
LIVIAINAAWVARLISFEDMARADRLGTNLRELCRRLSLED